MNKPLVTVCVITYNSSKFVLETLESIKAQTYENIELIVSDDCSKDNTIEVCKAWIYKNNSRFANTKLITSKKNTGIAANANRGLRQAKGEWVKGIAGDDILLPNCLSDNIEYVLKHPEVEVLFSNDILFYDWNNVEKIMKPDKETLSFYTHTATQQYDDLFSMKGNKLRTTTLFLKVSIAQKYLYNEKYRNLEDWPEWFNLTEHGIKISYMDKNTIRYRVGNNISVGNKSHFTSDVMYDSLILFYYDFLKPEYRKRNLNYNIEFWEKLFTQHYLYKYTMENRRTRVRGKIISMIFRILRINTV